MTDAQGSTAPVASEEQLEARHEAIEISGWGNPLHLVQPRNLAFWVWCAGVLYGAWSGFHVFSPTTPVAGPALAVGALVAAGYGFVLWLFFRWIDRYDRLPVALLVTAFIWGGLAATYGMAIHANDAIMGLMSKLIGQGFQNDWGAALSAPFVEESAKGVGFLLLLALAPTLIRSPRAALVAGAFIGLGFQILEDDLYSVNGAASGFFVDQTGAVLHMAGARILGGLISHPAYTALFCVGILYLVGTPAVKRSIPRGLGFLLIPVLIHGIWDGAAAIGDGGGPGVMAALLVSSLLAIFSLRWAFRLSQPLEQQWMRQILDPEVAARNVTTAEIDAASGRRKERRAFVKNPDVGGGKRSAKHVLEAVIDLAHELAVSEGEETPEVEHARSELLRLRTTAA